MRIDPNEIPNEEIAWSDEPVIKPASDLTEDEIFWDDKDWGKAEWGDVLSESVKNIPESGKEYIKSAYEQIIHPIETVKSLKDFSKAFVKTGALRIMAEGMGFDYEKDIKKDAEIKLIEGFEKDYTTIEGWKNRIATDPVGAYSDILFITAPGLKATGAGKVLTYIEPISGTVKLVGQPFKLIKESLPQEMYKKAVKFGTTLSEEKITKITKTALTEDIMPTIKGVRKLKDKIGDLNNQISELIKSSDRKNIKLRVTKLKNNLDDQVAIMRRITDDPIGLSNDVKKLNKKLNKMVEIDPTRRPTEIQKIKTGIYRDLESFYEKQRATPAKVKLRKHVAKNARIMLEELFKDQKGESLLKKLNRKDGDLIELYTAIESKANRISNRDIFSIGLPIKAGAGSTVGYALAGEQGAKVGALIGLSAGILDAPTVKSKMAIVIDKLRRNGFTMPKPLEKLGLTGSDLTIGVLAVEKTEELTKED